MEMVGWLDGMGLILFLVLFNTFTIQHLYRSKTLCIYINGFELWNDTHAHPFAAIHCMRAPAFVCVCCMYQAIILKVERRTTTINIESNINEHYLQQYFMHMFSFGKTRGERRTEKTKKKKPFIHGWISTHTHLMRKFSIEKPHRPAMSMQRVKFCGAWKSYIPW